MQLRAGPATRITLLVLSACQVVLLVTMGLWYDLPGLEGGVGPPLLPFIAAGVALYW